jgi:hypothetical protein
MNARNVFLDSLPPQYESHASRRRGKGTRKSGSHFQNMGTTTTVSTTTQTKSDVEQEERVKVKANPVTLLKILLFDSIKVKSLRASSQHPV